MTKDKQVWELYTRHVKAVRKTPRKPLTAKSLPEKTAARQVAETFQSQSPTLNDTGQLTPPIAHPLERKREKALRQGEVEIDAKLDLHGLTQAEAFAALAVFMHKKAKAGQRHLLIITGKGRDGSGVLRANLQNWLDQLPEAKTILALRQAAPKHGGDGAFYVLLRKKAAS